MGRVAQQPFGSILIAGIALAGVISGSAGTAHAQYGGLDTGHSRFDEQTQKFDTAVFGGDSDGPEEVPKQNHIYSTDESIIGKAVNSIAPDTSANQLMGTGGPEDIKTHSADVDTWQNLDGYDSKHYRDSAEMRMREENRKALPERAPFGDPLADIEHSLSH